MLCSCVGSQHWCTVCWCAVAAAAATHNKHHVELHHYVVKLVFLNTDAPWVSAPQLALCYLFNPFTIASCVAGTLTSAENAAVLVAVAGGCLRNGPLVGFGLAVGAYLGLHPLLLLVRLSAEPTPTACCYHWGSAVVNSFAH
jgi:hypothetical protein